MQKPEVMKLKICLIGDGAVGKTSLISRYIYNQFDDKYLLTLGTKTSLKKIPMKLSNGRDIELNMGIWDIMGQKEFERLHKTFFKGAQGAIIVTDITRKETLVSVEEWILRLISVVGEIPMVFVANKTDLMDQAQFKPEELQPWAQRYNSKVYQCSAKTGRNVEEFFFDIGKVIAEKATGAKVLPPEKAQTPVREAEPQAASLVELVPLAEEPAPSSPGSVAPEATAAQTSINHAAPATNTPQTSSTQQANSNHAAPATNGPQASTGPAMTPSAANNQSTSTPQTSPVHTPASNHAPQAAQTAAPTPTPAPQAPPGPGAPAKERPRPPKPPPPEPLHAESEGLKEMRVSITNLNRTTQQLQQQISALQKELTELRALQTQKSGPSCPTCQQPATYIPQYKQFYCYKCKDYIDL